MKAKFFLIMIFSLSTLTGCKEEDPTIIPSEVLYYPGLIYNDILIEQGWDYIATYIEKDEEQPFFDHYVMYSQPTMEEYMLLDLQTGEMLFKSNASHIPVVHLSPPLKTKKGDYIEALESAQNICEHSNSDHADVVRDYLKGIIAFIENYVYTESDTDADTDTNSPDAG